MIIYSKFRVPFCFYSRKSGSETWGFSSSGLKWEKGRRREAEKETLLMGLKMQSHHSVAVRLNEQLGTKRGYTFIQANRAWLPKFLIFWIMLMAVFSNFVYEKMDAANKERREEVLVSMCDQRARMLQDQFSVSVNHVHALAILVSTFHYFKNPSAIDQV